MPYNNNSVITALPSTAFDCSVCSPEGLTPPAIRSGANGGGASVFFGELSNKLDASDSNTNNAKAVFTTSSVPGSNPFSLTVRASSSDSSPVVILPTKVSTREVVLRNDSGSDVSSLKDDSFTMVGATALSGGSLSWDAGGDSGRSAELRWNASNSLTVNSSGTTIVGPLTAASFTVTGATTINNNFAVDGNTTLGDASASTTDTLDVYARSVFHNTSAVPEFKNGLELSGTGKNLTFGANTITGSGNITTSAGTITGKSLNITGSGGTATVDNTPTSAHHVVRYEDVNINSGATNADGFKQPKIVVTNGFITAITEGTAADATSHGAYHHTSQLTADSAATGAGEAGALYAYQIHGVMRNQPVLNSSGANGIMITNRTDGNYTYATHTDDDNAKYTDSLFKVIESTSNPVLKGPPGQLIFRKKA